MHLLWWFDHLVIYVPPLVILIVLQSIGFMGYSLGFGPCYLKPSRLLYFLLSVLPFTVATGVALILLAASIGLLLYRTGLKGLMRQFRLVFFVIITSFYTVCSQVPPILFIRSDDEAILCIVNNWILSKLYRNPEVFIDNFSLHFSPA